MPSAVSASSFKKKKPRKSAKKTVAQGVRKPAGRIKIKGKKRRFKALTPAQMQAIRNAGRASAIKRKGKRNFRKSK